MTRIIRLLIAATVALPVALSAQTPALTVANSTRATAAAPVPLDSAINRLQDFLNRYPSSPLRPNALLQLGELLVRQADTVFAQGQRTAGVATGTYSTRAGAPPPPPARPAAPAAPTTTSPGGGGAPTAPGTPPPVAG